MTGLVISWVDLLDVDEAQHVLLVGSPEGAAAQALRALGARLAVTGPASIDGLLSSTPDDRIGWELVCVDGVGLSATQLRSILTHLAPGGRVAMLLDNRLSPLRILDRRRRGDSPGPRAARFGPHRARRSVRRAGLEPAQLFGVVRSTLEPVTAFDLDARTALPAVVGATTSHVSGWRGRALQALASAGRRPAAWLVPGWVVVGHRPGHEVDANRIVGKIANRDSDEIKLVRGDPPAILEKHYTVVPSGGETTVLRELESVGFDLAPRALACEREELARFTWLPGRALDVTRLGDDELVRWVTLAARALARLHELTAHDDGTVIVHGDFWLGNLLVDDNAILGIVDWTEGHRGPPDVDRRWLVDSLSVAPAVRRRLEVARDRELPAPAP